jgi:inner membrane transporter RhtA
VTTANPPRWAPVLLVIASMTSVQVGASISVPLFDRLGVAGTTWLRLLVAALVLLAAARPRGLTRSGLAAAGALGVLMAANSVLFAEATARIPLGVAVAVEFCGPLAVAVFSRQQPDRHRAGIRRWGRRLLWPTAALTGVLLLTRPWTLGQASARNTLLGLGFAVLAGIGWAGYIVLMAHVGRRSTGLTGLAVAMTAAAVALAPLGVPQAWPAILAAAHGSAPAGAALATCAAAAALVPLLAFALELLALRRMDQAVFGVWMALEPAIGGLAGLALLGQRPALLQLPGFALVVAAGIGAQRAAHSQLDEVDRDRVDRGQPQPGGSGSDRAAGSASAASSASASAAFNRPLASARSAVARASIR